MKNPLDVGTKTIDAATVHCIRSLTDLIQPQLEIALANVAQGIELA